MSLLWTGAILPIATALLLAYVGTLVTTKRAGEDARPALVAFAVWWFSAASVLVITAMPTVLTLLGVGDATLFTALVYLNAVPLSVALCALLYYLTYIYTGRRSAIWPLALLYSAFFAFTLFYYSQAGPRHVEITAYSVRTLGEVRPAAWLSALFGILLAGPILTAVVLYASLFFRLKEAEQRYRVAIVSTAFGLWFAPVLVGFLAGWSGAEWFPLVYEAPGVFAATLIVLAFKPPSFVQRRWQRRLGPSAT